MEGGIYFRSGSMSGAYPYASEDTPKISVAGFMGYLKGKSSLLIYEKWGNLKFKYGNKNFWCRGYYVDTAGKNSKKIAEYIQNQLKTDELENPLPFHDGLEGWKRKRQE